MVYSARRSPSAEQSLGCSVGMRRQKQQLDCSLAAGTAGAAGFITIGCCSTQILPGSANASYSD